MAIYNDDIKDEVRANNDIVDVISQYVVLKRSGRNFFGLCPFHKEKSPSFSVSPDKQIYHCFGCHEGGDVIRFIQKIENISFVESMQHLAERSNITLPTLNSYDNNEKLQLKNKVYEINKLTAEFYHNNLYLPTSKLAQEYVKKRKMDNKTLKTFLIGYSGTKNELYQYLKQKGYSENEILSSSLVNKNERGQFIDRFRNRLMIPILDVRDRVIAFGGRVLDDSLPKYINTNENIVYSKRRNLFGLNVAKKADLKRIIIVEGYMDAISLYQRGINNVVASLGTALTEEQGRLLSRYTKQIIIGYDSDAAGQAATLRGLEILKNLGFDVRILQIEDAKDPDEYVIKFGSGRFNLLVEKAISLVEFKVKVLKSTLDIEHVNDKIKFLNEIAKILSEVDNQIEKEIYMGNIAKEYGISEQAIYAEINKLVTNNKGKKILTENRPIKIERKKDVQNKVEIERENLIISLLINKSQEIYSKVKDNIQPEDLKDEQNQEIMKKLYEELEKGNSNIYNAVDLFDDEKYISKLTEIMALDLEVLDIDKFINEIINIYKKEKLLAKRNYIFKKMEENNLSSEEKEKLENQLNDIIIQLSRIK